MLLAASDESGKYVENAHITNVTIVSLVDNGGDKCDNLKFAIPKLSPETAAESNGCLRTHPHQQKEVQTFSTMHNSQCSASTTRLVHDYITPTYPLETTYARLVNGSFSH